MKASMVKVVSVGLWLVVAASLAATAGCRGRQLDQARQEARTAKARQAQLEIRLNQSSTAIANLREEMNMVRQDRDDLQRRINKLIDDRRKADAEAEKAHGMVEDWQTQAVGQANAAASMEQQVANLTAQVAQLQATIREQQTTITEQQEMISLLQTGVAEMWDGLEGETGAQDYSAFPDEMGY